MKSEKALISILKEQINSYRILQDLLLKEKASLIKMDAEKAEEISKEKDTLVMRLRLLEEERLRLTEKITDEKGIGAQITVRELAELTGNRLFSTLRSQLLSLLQTVEELNRFNSILIDRSINYITATTGFFNSFMSEQPQSTGVLLSKET